MAEPGVVPHAGTWIGISASILFGSQSAVVPYEGTWIEIIHTTEK